MFRPMANDFWFIRMLRIRRWERSDSDGRRCRTTSHVHFLSFAPASCAIAASVVCVAFKPRRKSLFE
jgi:hypothetical protein